VIKFNLTISILLFGLIGSNHANSSDWRITPAAPLMTQSEMRIIGDAVCGEGGYSDSDGELECNRCPEFTGSAGANSGLIIGYPLRGRFSSADQVEEWISDTEGCEAHFANFGGAVLLIRSDGKVSSATSTAMNEVNSASGPLAMVYYKPGFRLDDCLVMDQENGRSLLVCNEADMFQGEVIGHISVMEISSREITRWRLLRWYDNSTTYSKTIVAVVPVAMRQLSSEPGQKLEITLTIMETTREAKENNKEAPSVKTVRLEFERKDQSLFATPESQQIIGEINQLIGNMLD